MLLIISNSYDVTTDYLIEELEGRRLPFFRLNTDHIPHNLDISIDFQGTNKRFRISDSVGRKIRSDEVDAVYFRQPRITLDRPTEEPEKTFFISEIGETQSSLWRILPKRLWLNHPTNLWYASNKGDQLNAAAHCGLNIPPTIISSSKEVVIEFMREQRSGYFAFKAVRDGFVHTDDEAFLAGTQLFTLKEVQENWPDSFLPMTCQPFIESKSDIRAIVVDEEVLAAKIHDNGRKTAVDWRTTENAVTTENVQLPRYITNSLTNTARHFGLNYAAADLLETEDGSFYFLELNPNGQWAWLDFEAGMNVRASIADALESRFNVNRSNG